MQGVGEGGWWVRGVTVGIVVGVTVGGSSDGSASWIYSPGPFSSPPRGESAKQEDDRGGGGAEVQKNVIRLQLQEPDPVSAPPVTTSDGGMNSLSGMKTSGVE